MKKKTPILNYYRECIERKKKDARLHGFAYHLGPDANNLRAYGLCETSIRCQIKTLFGEIGYWVGPVGKLTPLRENMILLCAAFHGEL